MSPALFGLAERDHRGEADHERMWRLDTGERAIRCWREGGRNQFGVFESTTAAAERFGVIFDLVLHRP